MGTLVVHCANRPKDEVFEVGNLGAFVNMHVYKDVPGVDDTVKVGTPIPSGQQQKLPVVDGMEAKQRLVETTLNRNPLDQVPADETPKALEEPPKADDKDGDK